MISPGLGASYADDVAEIYRDAELRILARIAAALAKDLDAPGWEQLQLARLQVVRADIIRELSVADPLAASRILASLNDAYLQGQLSVYADIRQTIDPEQGITRARRAAVGSLAADTAMAVTSTRPAILRAVDDVFRRVVANASASVLAGGEGRAEATQRALNDLLGRGLRGIDTKRGTMNLPDYVTMAVRTATARSAIQGHTDTMDELGLDLVIISPGPRACKICDGWARMILSKNGRTGSLQLQSEVGGKPIVVTVDDTLNAARAAGWGHPNCRCGMHVYIPGVTKREDMQRPPWNEAEYEAQQRQRGIESQIRAWKTRQVLAITPGAADDSKRKVAAWQKAQRDHMKAHPYLKRQSKREQITGTLGSAAGEPRALASA